MKKLVLVMIILFMSLSLSALDDGGYLDVTGEDWILMNLDQKRMFMMGFFIAIETYNLAIEESTLYSNMTDEYGMTSNDYFKRMRNFFSFEKNVDSVITTVDEMYKEGNPDYTIWSTIMVAVDRVWWE